jgi:type II secretory pathway predicted ATPase ExeA
MYYRHFGLNGPPFQFGVSPAELYEGHEHAEAIAALTWGLAHEPTGYTLLVGEPGTGKTTIIRSVLARHRKQIKAAFLNYPKAEPLELFRNALRQLGSPASQVSKFECVQAFRACLNGLRSDERLALVLDEAQALSPLLFEELRLLANCVATDERHIQVIFVGQPSILKRLEAPMLRQLNERIGTRVLLRSMQAKEVLQYIEHRIRARNGSVNRVFARRALDLVVEHSHGIPRRVNVLCHNAMLSAYSEGAPKVRVDSVRIVVNEFENLLHNVNIPDVSDSDSSKSVHTRIPVWRRFWKYGASAAVITALGIGSIQGPIPGIASRTGVTIAPAPHATKSERSELSAYRTAAKRFTTQEEC